jgi:hypothetical protein
LRASARSTRRQIVMAIDPVCGMTVDPFGSLRSEHAGTT